MSDSSYSSSEKGDFMNRVKQQMVVANTQELITRMSEKCFKKCIGKPGTVLDSSEQAYRFARKYIESSDVSEMHSNVYGPIYGLNQPCFKNIRKAFKSAREFKHLKLFMDRKKS